MSKIKIEDLPRDMDISQQDMKKIVGGTLKALLNAEMIRYYPFPYPWTQSGSSG